MIKELLVKEELPKDLEQGAVILEFYSKTCGPCKMLGFILKDMDKTYGDKIKIITVDFEANPDLVAQYKIEGYPTMIMFKDGQELSRKTGLQPKPVIAKMIEEAI
ncbi:MAG: thioredoxin domain-containing protein [Bacillota bacterium]|nr:thioredoxin domain-containing protein [Bacillota bacterium]